MLTCESQSTGGKAASERLGDLVPEGRLIDNKDVAVMDLSHSRRERSISSKDEKGFKRWRQNDRHAGRRKPSVLTLLAGAPDSRVPPGRTPQSRAHPRRPCC